MDKIYVWTKKPGDPPRHVWMSPSLKNLQRYVGGYIETVTISSDMVVICNEESRLLRLPHNCEIYGIDFVGDIIFVGIQEDEFADCPVDAKAMKQLFPHLWE